MDMSRDIIKGMLPDPFVKHDGTRLTSRGEWNSKRSELISDVVPLLFGGMPPEPEAFELVPLSCNGTILTYRIVTGTKEKTVSFELKLELPDGDGKHPVVLTGDDCFEYFTDEVRSEAHRRGFVTAVFNRDALYSDIRREPDSKTFVGELREVYSDYSFGAISAWAWGYSRCVDALLKLGFIDTQKIAITGHSRGGKTTLLAAAVDERIAFCQSNCSGAAGCGCFRYKQFEDENSPFRDHRSEFLSDLLGAVPYWLGPDLEKYVDNEDQLPFDMHFLKAAVAPRYLLETDSIIDIWANPRGSWQTYRAAKEIYGFLGAEDNIALNYHDCDHCHDLNDYKLFFDFIESGINKTPFDKANGESVMNEVPLIFNWKSEK